MIQRVADEMTPRQRLLAAYRGEEVDRLPYWAKVTNSTWRTSQPQSVRRWSDVELLDYIYADGLFGCPAPIRRIAPHVDTRKHMTGQVETRVTDTPDGELVEKWSLDPATKSWHPTEFPIKTAEDVGRYRWCHEDVRYEVDEARLAEAGAWCDELGDRGVRMSWSGTSPLMDLVEHIVGPINVHLMLHDYPDEMDELIALMHADRMRRIRAIVDVTPADGVISGENTSTTLISPAQFEKYCYVHLCDYGRVIEAGGKMHELHMCGHTRVLLELIDTIPASSIEAYTSPTLGNTRLVDGRTSAPGKTLIGGTNVNVWLLGLEEIRRYILDELAACPNHRRIVLTTAGVAPPGCPAEVFREIGQWLRTVQVRM